MTDWFQTFFESLKYLRLIQIRELFAKALDVGEGVLVDEADEAEEFKQRVLKRRRGEKQLVSLTQCKLECVRDNIRRLVDVAEPMRFVDDHEVPRRVAYIGSLAASELI